MFKLFTILWNSFKLALQELRNNKLRTFLSLFGVTIGIFCIIGVLATVDSLERKVKTDLNKLGSNSIWIDKWEYMGGGQYPWWKYLKRPVPKFAEMEFIKKQSQLTQHAAFYTNTGASVEETEKNERLDGISLYGVSEAFLNIQSKVVQYGRVISSAEYKSGSPNVIMGYLAAQSLFINPERAIGKQIKFKGKYATVIGVLEKEGQDLVGGFDYDNCIILPYKFMEQLVDVETAGNPVIIVQGKPGIKTSELSAELRGLMRRLHHLGPLEEDDFSLNDINFLAQSTEGFFKSVNIGGWAIAGLSLIVGAFGVANIMFVTVRERTSQIGLKKAIGAKSRTILTEFLLESAFLCILGGLIGLILVWLLTKGLSAVVPFPIAIAPNIIILALSICITLGILSGIIPASIAARMDPVVAIRTK